MSGGQTWAEIEAGRLKEEVGELRGALWAACEEAEGLRKSAAGYRDTIANLRTERCGLLQKLAWTESDLAASRAALAAAKAGAGDALLKPAQLTEVKRLRNLLDVEEAASANAAERANYWMAESGRRGEQCIALRDEAGDLRQQLREAKATRLPLRELAPEISAAIESAREQHPEGANLAALVEEVGEVAKAALKLGRNSQHYRAECLDVAVVALRLYEGDVTGEP